MKKLNRILSAAVAACMSLTMFAGAAELDSAVDAPETETLTGTACVVTADGSVDTQFEYTVPVNATEEERAEIAREAAREAAGMAPAGRSVNGKAFLTGGANYSLTSSWRRISSGTFEADGGYVEITMTGIQGCTTVGVELNNAPKTTSVRNSDAIIVFYDAEYILIREGNTASFRIKGSPNGTARIIEAYQYY